MAISRPVEVSPVQNVFPIVDPATGRATETFQFFLLRLWERTGGFTDDFFNALTVANLGQIQGLVATGQAEALARLLGDVAAQGRLQAVDRLAAQVESLERRLGVLQGVQTSALAPTVRTRIITFTADDVYRIGSDVQSIDVYCVGGGGGGGGGRTYTIAPAAATGGGGGGGGGYAFSTLNASRVPATVSVTIGLGGAGGAADTAGSDGGTTRFGTIVVAVGGSGGAGGTGGAGASGGAGAVINGSLFLGGPGGSGRSALDGESAVNDFQAAPGGGGGGGNTGVGTGTAGGDGGAGSWRTTDLTGGGGTGGASGSSGSPGTIAADSDQYFGPGYGGGGGGGASALNGDGGDGGDGVVGAGGGGGGGGADSGIPGIGGNGGNGRVVIVEHL